MTRRLLHIFAPTLLILFLCGLISQTAAGDDPLQLPRDKKSGISLKRTGRFSISGSFSGRLDGFIKVGGQKILITEKTSIFQLGKGRLKRGTRIQKSSLFVAGATKKRIPTASFVIVRPDDFGEYDLIDLRDGDRYRIPSDSDPRVGELAPKVPQ